MPYGGGQSETGVTTVYCYYDEKNPRIVSPPLWVRLFCRLFYSVLMELGGVCDGLRPDWTVFWRNMTLLRRKKARRWFFCILTAITVIIQRERRFLFSSNDWFASRKYYMTYLDIWITVNKALGVRIHGQDTKNIVIVAISARKI